VEYRTWLQREVNVLFEFTQAINASLSQQEVLDIMLERICTELGYKAATLRLLDEERQELKLKSSHGLGQAYLSRGAVEVARSGVDRAVMSGMRVALTDLKRDADYHYTEAANWEGLTSVLAVPISLQERLIGVLRVYTGEPHYFNPQEESFLAAVANLGALAIRRAHCFEAFQRIAQNINSSLELEDVLTTLLLESVKELNVKAGSIRLLNPKREILQLAAAYGLSETYLQKGAVTVAQSPIDQRVLNEGQPRAVPDVHPESGFQYPDEIRKEGIRSVLVLPLRLKETMIGVMRLYSSQPRRFSAEEAVYALALADFGAVAIENAKYHKALRERMEALKEDVNGWYRFLTFG